MTVYPSNRNGIKMVEAGDRPRVANPAERSSHPETKKRKESLTIDADDSANCHLKSAVYGIVEPYLRGDPDNKMGEMWPYRSL